MPIYPRKIGQRIVKHRKLLEWNQATLAYHSGVSVRSISDIENGKDTKLMNYVAIADSLNIHIYKLLEADDYTQSDLFVLEYYLDELYQVLDKFKKWLDYNGVTGISG